MKSVCDRESCGYVGELPVLTQKPRSKRMLEACVVTTVVHLGCGLVGIIFPLIFLVYPISIPVVFFASMAKEKPKCPACQRGELIAVTTPRGQALMERHNQ